jgi:hypothetical protein
MSADVAPNAPEQALASTEQVIDRTPMNACCWNPVLNFSPCHQRDSAGHRRSIVCTTTYVVTRSSSDCANRCSLHAAQPSCGYATHRWHHVPSAGQPKVARVVMQHTDGTTCPLLASPRSRVVMQHTDGTTCPLLASPRWRVSDVAAYRMTMLI